MNGYATKRVPLRRRWRWDVAHYADRIKRQCWADLVSWVQRSDDGSRLPWRPQRGCVADAQRCGTCYCGKVAREDVPKYPDGPRASVIVPMPTSASAEAHAHG